MKNLDDEQTAQAEKNLARMEAMILFHDAGRREEILIFSIRQENTGLQKAPE